MREDAVKSTVRQVLTTYLKVNRRRKTPERYAILDAVYSQKGHFTMEELGSYLSEHSFRVSRATLYNTLRLLIELRLVTKHHLADGTAYEAAYAGKNHCHQICTVCEKVTEIRQPEVDQAISQARLKRFKKDTYLVYFYGICSSCQARITRRKTQDAKKQHKKGN